MIAASGKLDVAPTNAMASEKEINLVWWNVNDFFHFDSSYAGRTGRTRWPKTLQRYEKKSHMVDVALKELTAKFGAIDILCLCEITNRAATDLRDRMFPGYNLISLDVKADDPTLQVAIIYPSDSDFVKYQEKPPIVVPNMPAGSRPMAVLQVMFGKHTIRVIACHWQARIDEESSEIYRFRAADFLSTYSFDFISEKQELNDVIIVGDLNEEPYERSLGVLNTHRHRGRSLKKFHWTDHNVRRVHLYNTSWRHLGEKHPYPSAISAQSGLEDCAGTYYWEAKHSWHNFDHVIVSGGLLQDRVPFIDESKICIVSLPAFLTDGFPIKFSDENSSCKGLSDHLPIFVKISI